MGKIYESGHLQKGEKPVHWCQDCGSALAEAEVEYQDKVSKSIDVAFKVDEESIDSVKTVFGSLKMNLFLYYMDNYSMDNTIKCSCMY